VFFLLISDIFPKKQPLDHLPFNPERDDQPKTPATSLVDLNERPGTLWGAVAISKGS
jgi:hypothetical protein